MKKILIVMILFSISFLVSCDSNSNDIVYTDDSPIEMNMKSDSLNILQITDLHLTYGIDANDRATFKEIKKLVEADNYDLIIVTGDMVMSVPTGPLFHKFVTFMESFKTPWTFIFGNHDAEAIGYGTLLSYLDECQYLYFKVGPAMIGGGIGNFRIIFKKDGIPFYTLYFLDSHSSRKVYTEEEGEYDYLKISQVNWVMDHQVNDTTNSIMFFHIPLREYKEVVDYNYNGTFDEPVCPQGINTGLFDKLVTEGKTKGIFVGHDHLNDYDFILDGILLAYGHITGYNAYGNLPRGGRVIQIDSNGVLHTHVVLESEVS